MKKINVYDLSEELTATTINNDLMIEVEGRDCGEYIEDAFAEIADNNAAERDFWQAMDYIKNAREYYIDRALELFDISRFQENFYRAIEKFAEAVEWAENMEDLEDDRREALTAWALNYIYKNYGEFIDENDWEEIDSNIYDNYKKYERFSEIADMIDEIMSNDEEDEDEDEEE